MLKRVTGTNLWLYSYMDFLNFGFVGAIKSQNFRKIFGNSEFLFRFCKNRKKFQLTFSFTVNSIRTIALDMRGYNLSERPTGSENYKISYIIEDLRALIEHSSMYGSRAHNDVQIRLSILNFMRHISVQISKSLCKKLWGFKVTMTWQFYMLFYYYEYRLTFL